MKSRFILFRRAGVFYSEDTTTRKQISLRTKDEAEALTLLHSKNEAHRQPVLNLQIARTYLTATDPEVANRTWQTAMDELTKTKSGNTHARHVVAMKDKAFDLIRNLRILETHSAHFLKVLELGTVSTNVYLRRIQNFAMDMNWLSWSILPKRQWPKRRQVPRSPYCGASTQSAFVASCPHDHQCLSPVGRQSGGILHDGRGITS
jgi:hypothetical protein